MAKNNYVKAVKIKESSYDIFKKFMETRSKYSSEFWDLIIDWMNDLPKADKKKLLKEIEDKNFQNSNDIWAFLGFKINN